MRLLNYDDAFEFLYLDSLFYKNAGLEVPEISMFGFEEFLSIVDINHFFTECCKKIFTYIREPNNIYFFIKLNNYYKGRLGDYLLVWKRLSQRFDISFLELGPELIMNIAENKIYTSMAKIKGQRLKESLLLLKENMNSSFIYISNRDDLLTKENIESIFYNSINKKKPSIPSNLVYDINYFELFDKIKKGEHIVSISTDGEEIGLYVFGKTCDAIPS